MSDTDNFTSNSIDYKSLDGPGQIRLLRIPADNDSSNGELITSSLVHAKLDDRPTYTALSYVWGDARNRLPISVNGSVVSITKNLHEALTSLRESEPESKPESESEAGTGTGTLTLWVDALCINQADNAEKAVQVQLMRRIYHDAARVVIWLGLADAGADSAAAIWQLRDVGTRFQELRRSPLYALRAPAFLRSVVAAPPTTGPQPLRSVWYLFRRRPYWRRVWVVQEAVLARRATVRCGRDAVGWDVVLSALTAFQLAVSLPRTKAAATAGLSIVADVNRDIAHFRFCAEQFRASGGRGLGLMETLWWTLKADIQATDPRDRVYGLLGLIKEEDRALIPVDYSSSMTLDNVLFDVTRALLQIHGSEIFCYCIPSLTPASLPSWVVDWTTQKEARLWTNRIGGAWTDDSVFSASKGMRWDSDSLSSLTLENPILRLPGLIVSSIIQTGSQFTVSAHAPAPEYLHACRAWLIEVQKMVTDIATDPNVLQDRLENLWRLPIADKDLEGGRAKPDDEASHHYQLLVGAIPPVVNVVEKERSMVKTEESLIVDKTLEYRRRWYLYDRRPFVTNDGCPGLALADIQPGDQICVLAGASVPFVIRRNEEGNFRLVGESYIYGLMDGEWLGGGVSSQNISLV